ncbi:ABC transporter substrate-binding protein [Desulfovibrio sp. ZJ369]|uniref:ABC transporter substrate-binding protein n=1 Tax=Desulfovibrio sp. ZJ369 TaxID=2709793 RepID=UPI0013EBF8EC|nr:ABC transporter substrate-binding protein [Desulfovibrio sp. ZJ369]
MRLKKCFAFVLLSLFCLGAALPAQAADLIKVPTAWLPGQEAFPMWYAKQQGWDKEAGLDVRMYTFDSGADALRAFPAKSWVFGGLGAVPAMLGALRYNMSTIGLGNDEAMANAIMVRADSPILKTKGCNKDCPDIYGSPESVRGKTILCTRVTSADYALHLWLKALGLKESDIVLKNLEQAPALTAFDYNIGDAVVLWAPFTFVGDKRGWKTVATPKDCGKHLPIVLVADTAYAMRYPDVAKSFLTLYLRGVNWLQTAPRQEVIAQFKKYYLELLGQDYSTDLINLNLKTYEFFNLEAQRKLFAVDKGPSEVQQWQSEIAEFFASVGLITQQNLKELGNSAYVTSKYIDLVTPQSVTK